MTTPNLPPLAIRRSLRHKEDHSLVAKGENILTAFQALEALRRIEAFPELVRTLNQLANFADSIRRPMLADAPTQIQEARAALKKAGA